MKYSYNWLKELSGTKLSPEKVANILTMRSMEVEGLEKNEEEFKNIVVGKILEIKKHPNADKLQITIIETQDLTSAKKQKLQIVCGAPNIEVGQKIPVALVSAKLPNGLEIKESKIRGEKSFGMLCALDELGLGDDHSGIIILDKKAKVGESVKKYLGLSNDLVLEIKVLPDRAHDAMSHVGVAREISVLEGRKFDYDFEGLQLPKIKKHCVGGVETQHFASLQVRIEDKKLCSRYIGAIMENIEIKDSPEWIKDRLKTCGIKSINNVVDATNYVMLELGQPLHAFDAEKISGKKAKSKKQEAREVQIVVRRAKKNEELELLDEIKLKLSENDLLITNGKKPLALAGIMGGLDSGINKNTKTIVLEAASFDATNIRRSRSRLGIRTESSDRFEKDIDPNLAEKAMVRIIEILEHTAGAKLGEIADVYPNKIKSWKIELNLEYTNNLLGEKIPRKEVTKILNLLGVKTTRKGENIVAEIPTYRLDLRTQENLIEEVGRVWGYEKIEIQPIAELDGISAKVNEQLLFEKNIKKFLANIGYNEMYNYSFYSSQDVKNCFLDIKKHFELVNPMNPDQQFIRTSLIPGILKNIKTNLKHFESFNLFEIGKVYYNNKNIEEQRILVMVKVLKKDKKAETFYTLKGEVENLLNGITGSLASIMEAKLPRICHPTRSAEIEVGGVKIGYMGEINPIVLGNYKIEKRVAFCDIDMEKLLSALPKEKIFTPIQKFPTIIRDISLLAKGGTKAIDIQNLIKKIGGDLVLDVKMFDVFFKDGVTSFAYHIEFGKNERTLENKEVDEVMKKIILGLEKELNLEIRKYKPLKN